MKKMMTGNRKLKRRRVAAAAGTGLTAAAILITSVLGRSIDAQAAGTLMGIERLRTRVKESGSEYVALEIVPDKTAAEIGYLFDGYEPILGEWDEETGEWKSWRDVLCELETKEEREEFIQGKKEALQAYYEQAGLGSSVPVVGDSRKYEEINDGPKEGYEEITISGYRKTGWFTTDQSESKSNKYLVAFHFDGYREQVEDYANTLYYVVDKADKIDTETDTGNIPDDTLIYRWAEGEIFEYVGKWGVVKEPVKTFINNIPVKADEVEEPEAEEPGEPEAEEPEVPEAEEPEENPDGEPEEPEEPEEEPEEPEAEEPKEPEEPKEEPEEPEVEEPEYEGKNLDGFNGIIGVSAAAKINYGRWFLLSQPNPEEPGENPGGEEPGENPGGEEPGENPGGEEPGENPGGEEPGENPGGEEPGENPGGEPEEPKVEEPEGKPAPGTNGVILPVAPANVQIYNSLTDYDEGYYIVTFKRVKSYDFEKYSQYDGRAFYSVIGSTIEANVNGDYVFVEYKKTVSDDKEEDEEDTEEEPEVPEDEVLKNEVLKDEVSEDEVLVDEEVEEEEVGDIGRNFDGFNGIIDVSAAAKTNYGRWFLLAQQDPDASGGPTGGEDDDIVDENPPRQTYTFPGRTIYCRNTFKSNEWFKSYVIDMDEGTYTDFPVKVLTLTPAELNKMAAANSLPEFDFLYLNSGYRTGQDDDSNDEEEDGDDDSDDEEEDGSDDETTDDDSDSVETDEEEDDTIIATYNDKGNDLSDDVLKYLVNKTIAGAKPCLVDGSILYARGEGTDEEDSGGTVTNEDLMDTNVFRLSAILCHDNLSDWYNSIGGNYNSVTLNQLIEGIVDDDDKNFVIEHVYCRYGNDSIINSLFYTPTIYTEGGDMSSGFQKVLDEILIENQYRGADSSGNYGQLSTDISQATAIRHILNYADRRQVETKEHIRVLEIQPARVDNEWEWTDENGEKHICNSELTLEQLQKWAPGVKSAEITSMTTAEFIGKIEKLNENYDLIYIGTSKDHLNMHYWRGDREYDGIPNKEPIPFIPKDTDKDEVRDILNNYHIPAGTAFNDEDMDGLIYYNIGDLRGVSMQLAGQLESEYVNNDPSNNVYYYNYARYGGNDITEEKMKALLSFLDGSYPVIVADDFFESPVTVYESEGYKGGRVNFSVGDYDYIDMESAGVPKADISAVKVKEGYQVTFYNDWFLNYNPDGVFLYLTLTEDESDLSTLPFDGWRFDTWSDATHSLKVERISEDVPPRTIDADHIDNCSYMYEFVKEAMEGKYINFFACDDIADDSKIFQFYLNRPKVSMTQSSVNGLRKEGSDIYYVEAGANGRYNLEYHFTIHNEGAASLSSRYECKLYIDINSDGKFSPQEEVDDITLTQGGGYVPWNNLYAEREYVLTREIPAGYKGLLPWRVEITQADNDNIYTSMSGYSKLEDVDREKITVLQIARDRGDWEPKHNKDEMLDLGKEIETKGTIYNALVKGGTYDGITYEGIDDDYDIDVTFKTISEYEQIFYGGVYQAEDEDAPSVHEPNPNYLEEFNMLILGFDDMYGDIRGNSTEGAMGAIVDFIKSGKSVLLSHDTTSYFQYTWGMSAMTGHTDRDDPGSTAESPEGPFAYSMNQYIRPLVGMDRYGILTSDILKKGNTLREGDAGFLEAIGSRYDKAYKPKSARIDKDNKQLIKTQLVPQVHGYTYIVLSGKDYNHNGGVNKSSFTSRELDMSQVDGDTFTNKYRNIRYDQVFYQGGESDYGELSTRGGSNTYGEIDRLWVTRTNEGQITEYPYKLPETFEIAETHGQYYQLDYTEDSDGDEESDLVVWFCLGKRGENGEQETVYSQSPNDVRNNYYIYNKGNITYTGMGHSLSDITHERNPDYTLNEAKLFINTIIAAYQAGIKNPYITVLKRGVRESEELKLLYRYYDRANDMHLNDLANKESYEKVYFTVQDINFIKGTRAIAANVYYKAGNQDGSETITVGGEEITVNSLKDLNDYPEAGKVYEVVKSDDTSTVDVLADTNNLQSGHIYYVMVPKSVMEDCEEGLDIYFEAQTTLTTNTTNPNVYVTDKVYAKLQVLQAYMFNLE